MPSARRVSSPAICRRRIAALLALAACLCGAHGALAAEPPPLEAYGRLPALELPRLSPSGARIAYAAEGVAGRRLVVATRDGEERATSALGPAKLRSLAWAGEHYVVAGSSDTADLGPAYGFRNELWSYRALRLRDGGLTSLLSGTRMFRAAYGFYGLFERERRWYAYFGAYPRAQLKHGAGARDAAERDLVEVDLDNGVVRTAASGCAACSDWLLGTRGELRASVRYEERSGRWQLRAGGQAGRLLVSAVDPLSYNRIVGTGRSADSVLALLADQDAAIRYMEIPLSGAAPREILDQVEVSEFIHDAGTQRLAGYLREADEPQLFVFDAALRARLQRLRDRFSGALVRFESWSQDWQQLIVRTEAYADAEGRRGDAGTYWWIDVGSGQARQLGTAYPQIDGAQLGPWRMVDYRAADGLPLSGVLTVPPDRPALNLPVVVLPHGGPEARDYPRFDWWAQAFASRGYAVWQPNFRGSSGYGAALRNAGHGEWGGKMQTDISDGVAELARQGIVDPQRACIVGASYGGYAALAGVSLQQGLYRCAAAVSAISDLQAMLRHQQQKLGDAATRYLLRYLGVDDVRDPRIAQRSPIELVARVQVPVLLVHGRDDVVVPHAQSRRLYEALRRAGKPAELVTLAGEDHWLSREQTRIQMLRTVMRFVQQHNPAATGEP